MPVTGIAGSPYLKPSAGFQVKAAGHVISVRGHLVQDPLHNLFGGQTFRCCGVSAGQSAVQQHRGANALNKRPARHPHCHLRSSPARCPTACPELAEGFASFFWTLTWVPNSQARSPCYPFDGSTQYGSPAGMNSIGTSGTSGFSHAGALSATPSSNLSWVIATSPFGCGKPRLIPSRT